MCACSVLLQGIAKARDAGFLDASGGSWRFDLAEYEHYEQVRADLAPCAPRSHHANTSQQVPAQRPSQLHCWACRPHPLLGGAAGSQLEWTPLMWLCCCCTSHTHRAQVENGDLNWILPGKLLAFSGPAARPTDYVGFRAMVPEDYWDYFRRRGIQAIVRLNKKVRAWAGIGVGPGSPCLAAGDLVCPAADESACGNVNALRRAHPSSGVSDVCGPLQCTNNFYPLASVQLSLKGSGLLLTCLALH